MNLMEWEVGIPGKQGVRPHFYLLRIGWRVDIRERYIQTAWEGGVYKLTMIFPEGSPSRHHVLSGGFWD